MRTEVLLLLVLALSIQVFTAFRHGFNLFDDGLQLASGVTLVFLVLRAMQLRTRHQKRLILQILDELGQPLTIFHGYLSMLADGSLRSLDDRVELLRTECEEMRRIIRKLVDTLRQAW